MDVRKKLSILADAAKYDASCASSGAKRSATAGGVGHSTGEGICHSYTPDGRCVSLLKILLTNKCTFDCTYCINRRSSDIPRAAFTPDEVVDLTLAMYKRNYIEGLFLSSGVLRDPDYTMELVIRVAQTLREVHKFGGYIHLKAVAGASDRLIAEAGRWCDGARPRAARPGEGRSVDPRLDGDNPRSPRRAAARVRARGSEHADDRRRHAHARRHDPADGQSPLRDLQAAARLLHRVLAHAARRCSAADGGAAAGRRPPPLVREHRLYEADWLVRFYGFRVDELTTPEMPNLAADIDPKLAWALRHRETSASIWPLDLNTADRELLLRVPGIGVRTVDRLIAMRRHRAIRLDDLARLRVPMKRTSPFVVTADYNPDAAAIDRLDLRARVAPMQQLAFDLGGPVAPPVAKAGAA